MLTILDREHYDNVRRFAEQEGCLDSFVDRIKYLTTYGCRTDDNTVDMARAKTVLGRDFAPHSFGFSVAFRRESGAYEHFISGGMIFDATEKCWRIHT